MLSLIIWSQLSPTLVGILFFIEAMTAACTSPRSFWILSSRPINSHLKINIRWGLLIPNATFHHDFPRSRRMSSMHQSHGSCGPTAQAWLLFSLGPLHIECGALWSCFVRLIFSMHAFAWSGPSFLILWAGLLLSGALRRVLLSCTSAKLRVYDFIFNILHGLGWPIAKVI